MNYNQIKPLDKKAVELLSEHQQKLYNRGMYAQMSTNGFAEADQRLGAILPAAFGVFAAFTHTHVNVLEEYFKYIDSLQENKGPMAVTLRRLARIDDIRASMDHGFSVNHAIASTNKIINHTAPKSYSAMDSLTKAFAPYLDYSVNGEINVRRLSLRGQDGTGVSLGSGPALESIEEMLSNQDQFYVRHSNWYVILINQEVGGSVSKMYFDGGTMSSIQYRGACVYNHLEEDYYVSGRHHLTQEQLEYRLKLLFTQHGWSDDVYRNSSFTPEEFTRHLRTLPNAWKPIDFTNEDLRKIIASITIRDCDDDYSYRDKLNSSSGEYSVPSSLAARNYSDPQSYMEWVSTPSKEVDPELIAPDAPPSFFEDQHHFYGRWEITNSNTIHVRGCYTTGEIKLSNNRDFEERHGAPPITLTDSSRWALSHWLQLSRQNYLDEVLYWFRRIKIDPPHYLLGAKAAYNPEPTND